MDVAAPVTKKIVAFGSKQVFLPKFTIALVRTPLLSPYHARFLVPLNFSKYDLRDYLYHAYNIKTHNIRSFVKQMPVRDSRDRMRHWFREPSKKYMTVEMETPFLWPEEPENYEPWGEEKVEQSVQVVMKEEELKTMETKRAEAKGIRKHAEAILKGSLGGKVSKEQEGKEGETATLLERWEKTRTPEMIGVR